MSAALRATETAKQTRWPKVIPWRGAMVCRANGASISPSIDSLLDSRASYDGLWSRYALKWGKKDIFEMLSR